MTKAEARRLLRITTDGALARELKLQRSTVRRWPNRVPLKYRPFVKLLGERIEATTKMAESVPF